VFLVDFILGPKLLLIIEVVFSCVVNGETVDELEALLDLLILFA